MLSTFPPLSFPRYYLQLTLTHLSLLQIEFAESYSSTHLSGCMLDSCQKLTLFKLIDFDQITEDDMVSWEFFSFGGSKSKIKVRKGYII